MMTQIINTIWLTYQYLWVGNPLLLFGSFNCRVKSGLATPFAAADTGFAGVFDSAVNWCPPGDWKQSQKVNNNDQMVFSIKNALNIFCIYQNQ